MIYLVLSNISIVKKCKFTKTFSNTVINVGDIRMDKDAYLFKSSTLNYALGDYLNEKIKSYSQCNEEIKMVTKELQNQL